MKYVTDAMKTKVATLSPRSTVQEAAKMMKSLNIGALPVCEKDRVLGMLTDRDITIRVTSKGLDPRKTKIQKIMTKKVISCEEHQDLREVARLMTDKQVGRLFVLSSDRKLRGLLTLGDIVHCLGADRLSEVVCKQIEVAA